MASLSSSLPQDLTRPQQPKLKKTTPKKKQRDQQQNEQKQRSVNANINKYHRPSYTTTSMRGDINIKSAILLLVLPAIIYSITVKVLFLDTQQPTIRDKYLPTDMNYGETRVRVDICNKIITKMKIFKRRAVTRKKKKKKKKRCPTTKNKNKKQFSMRVAGYTTYNKYVKSIGG